MKRILLIDDETNILKSLQRILEDDYNIEIVLGAKFAIERLSANTEKFDIIISDFMMPEVNGADFYNYIARQYPGLEQRIIFMTGGTYSAHVKKFFDTHPNICLLKPFEPKELIRVIESIEIK